MSTSDPVAPEHVQHEDQSSPAVSGGPILFVLCFILFVGGLALMGRAFHEDNTGSTSAWLFAAGIVVSSIAFLIPLARKAS